MTAHPTSHRQREQRAIALGAAAAAATAGFSALARASARRETAEVDEAVLHHIAPDRESAVRRTARALAPLGKWYTYVPTAAAIAGYLLMDARDSRGSSARKRSRKRSVLTRDSLTRDSLTRNARQRARQRDDAAGAAAVALATGTAFLLTKAFDRWLPQPLTPPGHEDRNKPVFPSGHAFGTGAVGLTAAYVLATGGHARASVALPVAATLPLLLAGLRMIDERHWASDIAGGYLGGIAVAGACLAGYELLRE